ncbi:MAG: hypothetical protein GX975_03695 [Clostridiales bacterium]|nr:hypothetical protein [Clostridiales bacterium]
MYMRSAMVEYEENTPANFALSLVENASDTDGALGEFLKEHVFEGAHSAGTSLKSGFYNKASSSKLSAELEPPAEPKIQIVNLSADGKPFLRLEIEEVGQRSILNLLAISEWKFNNAFLRYEDSQERSLSLADDGTLSYRVSLPSGFTLLLCGAEETNLRLESSEQLAEFDPVSDFVPVPVQNIYKIEGLYFEADVSALDNVGEPVPAEKLPSGEFVVEANYAPSAEAEEFINSVADPLYIGELWSKYMTNDVGGPYRGRNKVREECMLLKGSDLYTLATNWASSVDITFVSGHTIDSWTGEKVDNYIKYNDHLLSCDVYFEKNMTLTRTKEKRTDVFNNRMYFVYIEDSAIAEPGWYLADMMSLDERRE